jgi:hypothetical protein
MRAYKQAQTDFFFCVCDLGQWLRWQGYEPSFGEAWRTPEQAALNAAKGTGIKLSIHRDRLGIDIIIRRKGEEVGMEDYKRAGEAWKVLHPDNRWGGGFTGKTAGDYQHFSHTWGGVS